MGKEKEPKSSKELPVIKGEQEFGESALERIGEEAIKLSGDKLGLKKNGNIVIGTVNIITGPLTKHLKKRHEKFYQESKFHLVADIILAFIIVALVFVLVWLLAFQPKAQIALEVSVVSGAVESGQAETYVVYYKNNGKVDIKSATLSLTFPKNFVLQSVNPEKIWADQTNTFSLGDLPREANGKVKITGMTEGDVGSSQTLLYSLNYQENGQTANTLGSFQFPIESSVLSASFETPKQVYQGIDFSGTINLKNTGSSDITDEINLSFTNSDIAIKSISSTQAELANGVIIINGLKAGQSVSLEYEAATAADSGALTVGLETDLNINGQKIKQDAVEKSFIVAVPKFWIDFNADKDNLFNGDTVDFKLAYTNKEDSMVSGATLTIVPADGLTMVRDLKITKNVDKYAISGNTITLGDISAGQGGEVNISLRLSSRATTTNQIAGVIADVNYNVGGKAEEYQIFSSKLKFSSQLQVISKGLYYSAQGDQLGVGPLPPVVDVPTDVWVFWDIDNSGSELSNLTVSADLPANVGWTSQQTVLTGNLRYGAIGRKIVWNIDDVVAQGGNYRAGFELELIPTVADLGKIPVIISNITYTATDTFTGQQISGVLPSITADLKDDPTASGKGKVIQLSNLVK
jgi:hypothetical protein